MRLAAWGPFCSEPCLSWTRKRRRALELLRKGKQQIHHGVLLRHMDLCLIFFFLISYSFIPLCKVLEISNLKFCFFILELAKEL